jgi:hypothetical protein
MAMGLKKLAAFGLIALTPGMAIANDGVFKIDVRSVTGAVTQTGSKSFKKIDDLVNLLDNNGLRSIVPSYTNTSAASAVLSVRGLPATATYAANSTTLRFQVPSLNIDLSFTGATRDQSQDRFFEFLKGKGSGIVSDLLKGLAAKTPLDPVAGNPNSLMAQMAGASFSQGLGGGAAPGSTTVAVDAKDGSQVRFGLGARFGRYNQGDFKSQTFTVPLSFSWQFPSGMAFLVDAPLTYAETEGSVSYAGSIGAGLRLPVTDTWALTPSVRAGGVGSLDLGSAAALYSASVTSAYSPTVSDQFSVTIGNMISYIRSVPLNVGDYNLDYNLTNYVFRNGLTVSQPLGLDLLGEPLTASVFIADTRFAGDALYVKSYQEVGIFFSTVKRFGLLLDNPLEFGVTYIRGKDSNGIVGNFGFKF